MDQYSSTLLKLVCVCGVLVVGEGGVIRSAMLKRDELPGANDSSSVPDVC